MTTRRAILLTAVLLAACGGASEGPAAPDVAAPSPALAPPPPAPDPVAATTPDPGGVTTVAVTPPTPPATPPPLPAGLVLRESFGPGQGYERPVGKGVLRSTLSGGIDNFWAEYPGAASVTWTAPEQSWIFAGCSTDPWEAPSDLQPYNGCTVSPWTDGLVHFPDALLPFGGLSAAYVVSADLYPAGLPGTSIAIGLSASAATTANLQTAGQVWLVVRPGGVWELRQGTADVLASGKTTLSGYNPVSLRYDPVARQVSAAVNGLAVGPFDAPGVSPSYVVLEGQGVLDNLLVYAAP